jgi:TetR/AcrR family transcriptional regulator, cholesterol catabolism regulator
MVTTRNHRRDVIEAAGRLFAERGYHGTSMRDLARELGVVGSSLYAHVESKQDLLVEVVEEGARLFEESAATALAAGGSATERLGALISGHVAVVVDNIDVSRTFLNEARMLDDRHRSRVLAARDHYEEQFRGVLRDGIADGSFRPDVDPKTEAILVLSMLNAVERWYRPGGDLDRSSLADRIDRFALHGLTG